jgi:D-aminopeptidase
VGQTTVLEGDRVRTGVTAILPHGENPYLSRVPAAIYVGNGFGKLLGVTQVRELGELETPILLTCTLCVWKVADAAVGWMLALPGMENVRSINPVVGETNDGTLNDIRARPIRPEQVVAALESAKDGPVEEGAVGAGAGTIAFGWKGGIGTSSRVLPESLGGYTVGVLVQTNFGGILTMNGAPVGRELGQYSFSREVEGRGRPGADTGETGRGQAGGDGGTESNAAPYDPAADPQEWGSCMMVVATDAPLSDRNLERLAKRAIMGLARTGSFASNGSGDYVIAFSNAEGVRRAPGEAVRTLQDLDNERMGGLFEATVEATEEAIYNSLLKAVTVTSNGRTVEALPLDSTLAVLRRYRAVR